MATIAEYPYNEYNLYIVHHKKENRNYAILVPIDKNKKRLTISYARYLMSIKEKRILEDYEQVDHIDDDKTNDNINNLQILSKEENINKYLKLVKHKSILLKCPICEKIFVRRRNQTHLVKKNKATFCSRKCSTEYGRIVQQNKVTEELNNKIKENIIKEYEEKLI